MTVHRLSCGSIQTGPLEQMRRDARKWRTKVASFPSSELGVHGAMRLPNRKGELALCQFMLVSRYGE